VCVACSGGAEGSPTASPADPTPTPEPSIDAVGGIVVADCDPGADADCQIPGLRVVQPVPVGEQVRLSVRIQNVTEDTVGPVTMLVADSALEADLGALLPVAGCSRPCDHEASADGLELRAEFQAPIEAGKGVTFTLVLTAEEAADHLLDVFIFASPMADIGAIPAEDPTKVAEFLGVVVTVEEE
jgi:hypothetical protein